MVNHAVLQGRLVADPELRHTQSGISVCSFRVAWSEKYNENETKLFLSCTAWRGTGEMISKYFRKGKEIVVEGPLQTREWTDKDGQKRTSIEMTVSRAHFCGPKGDGDSGVPYAGGGYTPAGAPVNVSASDWQEIEEDGELPF